MQIGFQGCSAGLVGLRTAGEIVRGDPAARVLVVSVELSSLHFQENLGEEDLRGHALFADGSGAAVVATTSAAEAAAGPLRIAVGKGHSLLLPTGRDEMTWHIGATGFLMRLTSRVPAALSEALPAFVRSFHDGGDGVEHWAVHPGGPVILDGIARTLGLDPEALTASREVLRDCGNMSSATIFFVLERIARSDAPGAGIAFAFGPGLTAEGLAFHLTGAS